MNRKEIIDQYFDRIDTLSDENRIALRRSCGKMINELDAYTLSMFYRYIPDFVVNNSLNKWLLATCIHCLWNNNEKSRGNSVDAGYDGPLRIADCLRRSSPGEDRPARRYLQQAAGFALSCNRSRLFQRRGG